MKSTLLFVALLALSLAAKKKTIYLIRHGETNFNTDPVPRVRGRIDVALNDAGIAHAKAAGDFLANTNIGKIYYSDIRRARQTAEFVAGQHNGNVELIPDPFGSDDGGDYFAHPDRLTMPQGETFYSVMDRLRRFLVRFWESDEEVCTIATHGAITNIFALMITQAPLDKFWTMYMSACGVSKITMKGVNDFSVNYWNADFFLEEGERKYLKEQTK